jgi:hypothetical protein
LDVTKDRLVLEEQEKERLHLLRIKENEQKKYEIEMEREKLKLEQRILLKKQEEARLMQWQRE